MNALNGLNELNGLNALKELNALNELSELNASARLGRGGLELCCLCCFWKLINRAQRNVSISESESREDPLAIQLNPVGHGRMLHN